MPNYVTDPNNNTLNNPGLLSSSRFLSPIYNNAHESSIDESITNEHMQLSNGLNDDGLNQTSTLLNNHQNSLSPLETASNCQLSYLDQLNQSTNLNESIKLEQKSIDELTPMNKLSPINDQQTTKIKLEHNESGNIEPIDYFHQNV